MAAMARVTEPIMVHRLCLEEEEEDDVEEVDDDVDDEDDDEVIFFLDLKNSSHSI